MAIAISQAVLQHRTSVQFGVPGTDTQLRFKNYRVTGNMISGAKRLTNALNEQAKTSTWTCSCREALFPAQIALAGDERSRFLRFQIIPPGGIGPDGEPMFLRLNIGGTRYMLLVDALLRAEPSGFLAKFVQLTHMARLKVADAYLPAEDAYFFQRSPAAFDAIYQYYATGVVHRPSEVRRRRPVGRNGAAHYVLAQVCPASFLTELDFWRISHQHVGSCCADIVPQKREEEKEEEKRKSPLLELPALLKTNILQVDDTTFDNLMFGKVRRRMWTFLERPGSSMQAKAFELSSTLFVAISVMGLSFGTIPDFQVTHYMPPHNETIVLPNGTVTVVEKVEEMKVEHPAFVFTERICIAFFTVEYCLRLFAAPRKLRFALKPLNLVDLLAIVPFYLELLLTLCGVDDKKLRDLRWAFLVVRILRVLRVIRIIKLGRFSSGLQTFGMTLQRSQKQLQMMTIVLLTGVVFFSTMIYFLEKDEDGTPFTSIPAAYWWCIVTMTTVGYGDAVPATTMLALPITIIVDNFIKVAQDEQQAEQAKLDQSRQELALQAMLHGDED
ncbi:K+ channel tetramerisation domain protein [Ancylostoma ceylanicum]|uniref:K+ channel tetramerisation domain protein n=1 Tax=Ancylostoma ceylanicum TaxID=53326 RepID=A0A0D6LAE4_9BILA|nr:K+ channel tetramerisation domain protein [Ancylostoma ceylanicum]